jgi:hypothetical protein
MHSGLESQLTVRRAGPYSPPQILLSTHWEYPASRGTASRQVGCESLILETVPHAAAAAPGNHENPSPRRIGESDALIFESESAGMECNILYNLSVDIQYIPVYVIRERKPRLKYSVALPQMKG